MTPQQKAALDSELGELIEQLEGAGARVTNDPDALHKRVAHWHGKWAELRDDAPRRYWSGWRWGVFWGVGATILILAAVLPPIRALIEHAAERQQDYETARIFDCSEAGGYAIVDNVCWTVDGRRAQIKTEARE